MASLSLLTITSHHYLHRSHNTLTLHQSTVVSRLTPAPSYQYLSHQSHGTRVTVADLFGNMPVRVKHHALAAERLGEVSREWDTLVASVVSLILSWGSEVGVVARELEQKKKIVFRRSQRLVSNVNRTVPREPSMSVIALTHSLLTQASYIPKNSRDSWLAVSISNSFLSINGAISTTPAPTRQIQFMSLGIRPLIAEKRNNELFDEVNRLFAASTFGTVADGDDVIDHHYDRPLEDKSFGRIARSGKQRKFRKGIDRWPMYFLRITFTRNDTGHNFSNDGSIINSNQLESILELLRALVIEFLKNHGLIRQGQQFQREVRVGPEEQSRITQHALPATSQRIQPGLSQLSNNMQRNFTSSDSLHPARQTHDSRPKPCKRLRFHVDEFGSGVKLPTFGIRPTADLSNPASSWSRIKNGKPHNCGAFAKAMSLEAGARGRAFNDNYNIRLAELRALPKSGPMHNGLENKVLEGANPFLQSTKFEKPLRSLSETSGLGFSGAIADMAVSQPPVDEEISWIHPVSHCPFRFNARTGFVSPTILESSGPFSSSTLTSSSLGSRCTNTSWQVASSMSENPSQPKQRSGEWHKNFLKHWDNPIFSPTEAGIAQLDTMPQANFEVQPAWPSSRHHSSRSSSNKSFKHYMPGLVGKLSKTALTQCKVIAQVDRKFILAKLPVSQDRLRSEEDKSQNEVLVIIDQHAADERWRLENLLVELCTLSSGEASIMRSSLGHASSISTTLLDDPLRFQVSEREKTLYQAHAAYFARWGILYDLSTRNSSLGESATMDDIVVKTVPPVIVERCRLEPALLIQLLRRAIWDQEERQIPSVPKETTLGERHRWTREITDCPQGMLDMLNSRACRSELLEHMELRIFEADTCCRRGHVQ